MPEVAGQDPNLGSAGNRGQAPRESRLNYCTPCDKVYPRPQELKRHTRDKHEQKRKCPFCRIRWTRPARIRIHVLKSHGSYLNENEEQEILQLRGREETIRFLEKYEEITRTIDAQAPDPRLPSGF